MDKWRVADGISFGPGVDRFRDAGTVNHTLDYVGPDAGNANERLALRLSIMQKSLRRIGYPLDNRYFRPTCPSLGPSFPLCSGEGGAMSFGAMKSARSDVDFRDFSVNFTSNSTP